MKDKSIYLMSIVMQLIGLLIFLSSSSKTVSFGLIGFGFLIQVIISIVGRLDGLVTMYAFISSIVAGLLVISMHLGNSTDLYGYMAGLILVMAALLSPVIQKPKIKRKKKMRTQELQTVQSHENAIQPVTQQKMADNIQINMNSSEREKDPKYFATQEGATYHRRDCLSIRKTHRDDLIIFEDKDEAQAQKYRPCKLCRP